MFDFFKTPKTPRQLLEDKYRELIETNWVSWSYEISRYDDNQRTYAWIINWTDIKIIWNTLYSRETLNPDDYSYKWEYEWTTKIIGCEVWVFTLDDISRFAMKKLINQIDEDKEKARVKKLEEEALREWIEEEQKRMEEDRKFMEEYNRVSWISNEFNPQFKILWEIEVLGKTQEQILTQWNDNNNKILSKRDEFYNLTI